MPRYDGTGPRGDGPKTGRGGGYCNSLPEQEPMHPNAMYGQGRGKMQFGRGMRCNNWMRNDFRRQKEVGYSNNLEIAKTLEKAFGRLESLIEKLISKKD